MPSTSEKGESAVRLFEAKLLEAGACALRAICDTMLFDVAVYRNGRFYRFQVKRGQKRKSGSFEIPIRRIHYNRTSVRTEPYSAQDVDFMVGVLMETMDVYVFPMFALEGMTCSVTVNPTGRSKFAGRTKVDAERFRNAIVFDDGVLQL